MFLVGILVGGSRCIGRMMGAFSNIFMSIYSKGAKARDIMVVTWDRIVKTQKNTISQTNSSIL